MTRSIEAIILALLCAAAMLATWDHTREDSITFDEPPHLFAAAEYVQHGTHFTNLEHPPLAKLLAGLALRDATPPELRTHQSLPSAGEMLRFVRANRIPFRLLLARGRAPFRWLFAALIITVYLAARYFGGVGAALVAATLIALDPNLIAHAGIVHTDVAATLFMTLTVVLALVDRRWIWPLVGIALGLALLSKFTAALLIPFVVLAPWLRTGTVRQRVLAPLGAIAVAALVVLAGYGYALRAMDDREAAIAAGGFLHQRGADRETAIRYAGITDRFPSAGMFLTGMKGVQLTAAGEREGINFLHGRVSRRGFPEYFFVAFLLKSTPAFLAIAFCALLAARRHPGLLIPVLLLFVASIPSAYNIGVRHILPVYPLLAIAGATVLARRRAIAAVVVIAAVVSLVRIHPHEIGYFSFGGGQWLNDSNLDWGQDVFRLDALLRRNGWERDTTVVVFASPIMEPELARFRPLAPGPIGAGRYAVSSYFENAGPQVAALFEGPQAAAQMQALVDALHTRGRKIAQAGASITVWDVGPPP